MLQGVRETVLEALNIEENDNYTFDRKRKRWEADLPTRLTKQRGFVVAGVARTEGHAVELANRVKPDIITAETVLANGSSGIDAVNKILTFTDAIPVFVTSFPQNLLKASKRPEPAGLVTKPFDPQTLTSILREGHEHLKRSWATKNGPA